MQIKCKIPAKYVVFCCRIDFNKKRDNAYIIFLVFLLLLTINYNDINTTGHSKTRNTIKYSDLRNTFINIHLTISHLGVSDPVIVINNIHLLL